MHAVLAQTWDGPHHWFPFFPFGFVLFWVALLLLARRFWWRGAFARGTGRAERTGASTGAGAGPGGWRGGRTGGWPGARPDERPDERASAEDVLRHRFAQGQIDEAEYRARLAVLRGAPPQDTPPR